MRFSIIIPAHEAENRIRVALDSIKQQTFKDYELIVVCDACTDRTEEIAKENLIQNAINKCKKESQGENADGKILDPCLSKENVVC